MRRAFLSAGILLAIAAFSGCAKPSAFSARSVVLFVLDPLATTDVGVYGSPGARTPFLDRLARSGAIFRTCVSASTEEAGAAATVLGGVQPWQHGVRGPRDEFVPSDPPLARILRGAGLETAALLDREIAAEGLDDGFELYETVGPADAGGRRAMGVARAAARWIRELPADAPFFLFTSMPPDGDREVGRIVRTLEETGHLQRTCLLATSLRPEAPWGDNRIAGLAADVPLIGWGPFPFRGGSIRSDLSRAVDVLPTALEALRVGTPANRPGRALQVRKKPYREAKLNAYAEADPEGARAIRTVRWKYVEGRSATLFDLDADPSASVDRKEEHPAVADSLAALLSELPS